MPQQAHIGKAAKTYNAKLTKYIRIQVRLRFVYNVYWFLAGDITIATYARGMGDYKDLG